VQEFMAPENLGRIITRAGRQGASG